MREQEPRASLEPSATARPGDLTVAAALREGARRLAPRCGPDADREARHLLAGMLNTTPGRLALEAERPLGPAEIEDYAQRLARRAAGEPLQYVEGRAAFRQLELRVDPSVLIPRPETEQLVEAVLQWSEGRSRLRALDLGTGSGAIAISLALEGPFERVIGVDISVAALNVARDNAARSGVSETIELREGSLFSPLQRAERFHVIVSNPPYIALDEAEALPTEVRDWEPHVALFAGATGTEAIEAIVAGAPGYLEPDGLLAFEVAPHTAQRACQLVRQARRLGGPQVVTDHAGHQRIILAEKLTG